MRWTHAVRERAQARLAAAQRDGPPPFDANGIAGDTPEQVMVMRPAPTVDDGLPHAVRVAGAWAWRLILFVAAGYVLLRLIGILRGVVVPVAVALLLAAMFQPVVATLRRRGMNRSIAAALVLVGGLMVVIGGLGLIVQTFVSQFDDLSTQVREGLDEVQSWLARSPLHISKTQISDSIDSLQQRLSDNQGTLTSGALNTATTVGEVVAGFFMVLFTLFFFLRDGDRIWRFICRLLPRPARVPVARAGHYSWHTLVSYVHATVLVAFVDAVGIGIGLAVLRIPLALPLAALVFLTAFIPVIGATLSGAVAVLVALVTQGPVRALILLAIVIGVQQLEGHVLQPLIMGRAVALHPLAVILAIATGIVTAGIVGGLVAVPLLAVGNTAVRYLTAHPTGEPTPDHTPPGTEPTDDDHAEAESAREAADADEVPSAATVPAPGVDRGPTSPNAGRTVVVAPVGGAGGQ